MLKRYVKAPQPAEVYKYGLHTGNKAKFLETEGNKIILRWLDTSRPPIPRLIAKSMAGGERCLCSSCLSRHRVSRLLCCRYLKRKRVLAFCMVLRRC